MDARSVGVKEKKHFISFFPFILLLFYGPIFKVYSPTTTFGHGIPDIGLYEVLLLFWIFAFMMDVMHRNLGGGPRSFWYVNMGIYVFYVFLSLYWSYEGYKINTIREVVFSYLIPFIVALAAKNYVHQKDVFNKWVKHVAVCCVLLSIMSIIQFVLNLKIDTMTAMEVRGEGTLGNSNLLAIFLVLNIPVFLYVIKRGLLSKKLGISILLIIGVGVVSTISRKGIVTMLMTYIIFFVLTKQYKIVIVLLIFFILSALVVLKEKHFAERFQSEELSHQITGRSRVIPIGMNLLKKNVLFGRGYKGFYHYAVGDFVDHKYDPHNNYITALVDYGLIGFFLFMNIFIIPLYRSICSLSQKELFDDSKLRAITAIAIIFPFMASAFFAGGLMYIQLITSILYTYFAVFAFNTETEKH